MSGKPAGNVGGDESSNNMVIESCGALYVVVLFVLVCSLVHIVAMGESCIDRCTGGGDAVAPSQRVLQRRPHHLAARRIRRLGHLSISLLLR